MQDQRHQVFLSYSRADAASAEVVVTAFRNAGLSVWYDQMIPPNRDWAGAIVENLERSDMMVILFSAHSNASTQLARELAVADARKMLVYPAFVEDVVPQGGYAYRLATEQRFRLFPNINERAAELADELKRHLSASGLRSDAPIDAGRSAGEALAFRAAKAAPSGGLSRIDWAIIAAMIVFLSAPVYFISLEQEAVAGLIFWAGVAAGLAYTYRTQFGLPNWRKRLLLDAVLTAVGAVALIMTMFASLSSETGSRYVVSAIVTAIIGFLSVNLVRMALVVWQWLPGTPGGR